MMTSDIKRMNENVCFHKAAPPFLGFYLQRSYHYGFAIWYKKVNIIKQRESECAQRGENCHTGTNNTAIRTVL